MDQRVSTWLGHVKELSFTIGARGSGSPEEKRAADYCESQLRSLGYEPSVETFRSQASVFRPHLVAAAAFAFSYAIFLWSPIVSFIIAAVALVSELQELLLRPNVLRIFGSRKQSRNVFAKQMSKNAPKRDIILMGHMDTQRTPIIFSSRIWRKIYAVWSNVAMGLLFLQTFMFGAALIWPGITMTVWKVAFISAIGALSLIAITLEAELSPLTKGANDNATGAGLVLTMAKEIKAKPLEYSRVWFVCSGSEESLHEGAVHFLESHKREFNNPVMVNFEMLGCAGPSFIAKEGLLLPLRPDRKLLELVEEIGRYPEFGAYPSVLTGGCTEASDAIIRGIPAITLIGLEQDGFGPHWHMPSDTYDKMDPGVMDRAYRFAETVISRLDKSL